MRINKTISASWMITNSTNRPNDKKTAQETHWIKNTGDLLIIIGVAATNDASSTVHLLQDQKFEEDTSGK